MNPAESANPIPLRLHKMEQLWERFRSAPQARICRWLIQADEKKMVEAFLAITSQEDNPTPDFFLPFYAEFVRPQDYAAQLVQELHQAIAADQEALAREGIPVSWIPATPPGDGQAADANYFLSQLQRFAEQVPEAELVVAVLLPVTANRKLGKWIAELAQHDIPANLRVLVLDPVDAAVLAKAAGKFPDQILTAALALDMPDAMRQLAAAGNPADPGVQFRKAFLALSQAAAAGNLAEIKRLEAAPLAIARQQGWLAMEVAVHSLVAAAYIGINQLPEALQRYEQAYGLAKKARAAGEPVALTLAVQCLLNKGSVLMAQKAFPAAAKTYALAAAHAGDANDQFQVMEAKRMHGYCLEKCEQWEDAFRVEKEALAAAALLEEQVRLNSTLPYLGKALLELAYQLGYKAEYLELEEELNALAGPGWQSKVPTAKATVV